MDRIGKYIRRKWVENRKDVDVIEARVSDAESAAIIKRIIGRRAGTAGRTAPIAIAAVKRRLSWKRQR